MSEAKTAAGGVQPPRFMELLGVEYGTIADGQASLRLRVAEMHLRDRPMIHGGVLAALLDSVIGMAAYSLAAPGTYTVTMHLSVHFLQPAAPGDLVTAEAWIVHRGRRTAVGECHIRNHRGDLLVTGSAGYMYLTEDPSPVIGRESRPGAEGRAFHG